MPRALWTAASGMAAQQYNVDLLANNIANINTSGFKRQRTDFQDLYYDIGNTVAGAVQDLNLFPV